MTATMTRWMMMAGVIAAIVGASPARGDFALPSFFVKDPEQNSAEWAAAVASEKGLINTDVDFRSMTPGPARQPASANGRGPGMPTA